MSDDSVARVLRSPAQLVVVEAPAGCGKTFQGAQYAKHAAAELSYERVLILAHTHAACDVFSERTRGCSGRVEICTIDSLICQIASAYHISLNLPKDCGAWARMQQNGYDELASKVNSLITRSPMVRSALARRFPIGICDEHQDASPDQHAIAIALRNAGSRVRIFGDPMQSIYPDGSGRNSEDHERWDQLKQHADSLEELDYPHRWERDASELGAWIQDARKALRSGGQINLSGSLPLGVSVIVADNQARDPRKYSFAGDGASSRIYGLVNSESKLLIVTPHNLLVDSLRSVFGRRIPIWEGHTRDALSELAEKLAETSADPETAGNALCEFLPRVGVGCSPSALTDALLEEIRTACSRTRRGKRASIQALAATVLAEPNHRGVAKALKELLDLARLDRRFSHIKIDYPSEFWDAVRLGNFDDPLDGVAEMMRRRSAVRPVPPAKAISTIHKAKGLECDNVLLMPCDAKRFTNTIASRRKLYVAISRAKKSLTLVVSANEPSPLLKLE